MEETMEFEPTFSPIDSDGMAFGEDFEIDVYSLAVDIFDDWISRPTRQNLTRAREFAPFIEMLEQTQGIHVETVSHDIIDLTATKIHPHSIEVLEPVGVIPVDGMCYLDDVQASCVMRVSTPTAEVSLMVGDAVHAVPLQDTQLLLKSRNMLYRLTKEDGTSGLKTRYPPVKPFVDLDWNTPVLMVSGKQWYNINIENAIKDSPGIQSRLKSLNSPFMFTITSLPPRPLRDPNLTIFVTSNPQKKKEYDSIAAAFGRGYYPTVSLDLIETQGTAKEIVLRKAQQAYELLEVPVLVEDVSLYIPAFGNAPGPYVKSWMHGLTPQQLNKILQNTSSRRARTEVIYCYYAGAEGSERYFISTLHGTLQPRTIVKSASTWGFNGWFIPDGYIKPIDCLTYAQQLNTGYRSNALKQFFASPESARNRFLRRYEPSVIAAKRKKLLNKKITSLALGTPGAHI